jgi:hypothetical protein
VVTAIIDVVFGWNREQQRSKKGGGLFGFTRGFFVSTESQGSGTLHAHAVVYLHGVPTTSRKIREKADCPVYQKRVVELAESFSSAQYPIDIDESVCPICDGHASVIEFTASAYRRPPRGETDPPPRVQCNNPDCKAVFGSEQLVRAWVDKYKRGFTDAENELLTDAAIEIQCVIGRELESPRQRNDVYACVLTLGLLRFQNHSYKHCASCFKASTRVKAGANVCRFFRPALVQEDSELTASSGVKLK